MAADDKAAYCTGCGTRQDDDWDFCARCGARRTVLQQGRTPNSIDRRDDERPHTDGASASTATGTTTAVKPPTEPAVAAMSTPRRVSSEEQEPNPVASTVGAVLAIAAAIISAFALFPDYYSGDGSLASDATNVVYNVGPIAAWAVAGALLALKKARRTAAALLIGVTVAWAPTYLSSIGRVLQGEADGGLGFIAGLIGVSTAIAACVAVAVGLPRAALKWRLPHPATIALALASSAAIAFGLTTDSLETSVVIGAPGIEWIETGTDTMTYDCCSWSEVSGSSGLGEAGFILMPASIALVAVTAIFLASSRIRRGLLAGVTVVTAAHVFSAATWLTQPVDPVDDLGFSSREVVDDALSANLSALPGFWWMAGGLAGLALVLAIMAPPRPDEGRTTEPAPATPATMDTPPLNPATSTSTATSSRPQTATPTAWSGIALGVLATIFLGPVALYAGVVAALALAQNFIAGWLPSSWFSGNAADWLFATGAEGGAANYFTFMIAGMIAAGCVAIIKAAFAAGR